MQTQLKQTAKRIFGQGTFEVWTGYDWHHVNRHTVKTVTAFLLHLTESVRSGMPEEKKTAQACLAALNYRVHIGVSFAYGDINRGLLQDMERLIPPGTNVRRRDGETIRMPSDAELVVRQVLRNAGGNFSVHIPSYLAEQIDMARRNETGLAAEVKPLDLIRQPSPHKHLKTSRAVVTRIYA